MKFAIQKFSFNSLSYEDFVEEFNYEFKYSRDISSSKHKMGIFELLVGWVQSVLWNLISKVNAQDF